MEKEKTKTQQDSAYNFSEENPPTTPEQLQAFADDLGLQDFDPNAGIQNEIAETNFSAGFVVKLTASGNYSWKAVFQFVP